MANELTGSAVKKPPRFRDLSWRERIGALALIGCFLGALLVIIPPVAKFIEHLHDEDPPEISAAKARVEACIESTAEKLPGWIKRGGALDIIHAQCAIRDRAPANAEVPSR